MGSRCRCAGCDWAALRSLLSEVYTPESVDIWLTAAHRQFGDLTVKEMEQAGRLDEVVAAAARLVTGAYS